MAENLSEYSLRILSDARRVKRIRTLSAFVIPGHLQTEEDYSRAVTTQANMVGNTYTPDELAYCISERQRTREALFHSDSALEEDITYLDELGLQRPVGGLTIMAAQLDSLAKITAADPRVQVRIIPAEAGAHAGMAGIVREITTTTGEIIVYTEAHRMTRAATDQNLLQGTSFAFDRAAEVAWPVERSLRFLGTLAANMRQRADGIAAAL